MTPLLLATQNPGKIAEMVTLLKGLPYQVITPEENFDVEETGTTFEENARLKAEAFSDHHGGVLALADDSGLVIDALDGRPGVYSKRYADTDELRIQKILEEMKEIPEEDRKARFVSVIALFGEGVDEVFFGTVEGRISDKSSGDQGFGYDPIFIPEGYTNTFAELGTEIKNTMSHRARAIKKAVEFLARVE